MIEESVKTVKLDDDSSYANVFSFMGLPLSRDLDQAALDAVVMGIPYDLGTSGRAGARSGPTGIRQASANLRLNRLNAAVPRRRFPNRFGFASTIF